VSIIQGSHGSSQPSTGSSIEPERWNHYLASVIQSTSGRIGRAGELFPPSTVGEQFAETVTDDDVPGPRTTLGVAQSLKIAYAPDLRYRSSIRQLGALFARLGPDSVAAFSCRARMLGEMGELIHAFNPEMDRSR